MSGLLRIATTSYILFTHYNLLDSPLQFDILFEQLYSHFVIKNIVISLLINNDSFLSTKVAKRECQ